MGNLTMFLPLCLVTLFLTYAAAQLSTDVPNLCPQPTDTNLVPSSYQYGHPDDCSYYFTCDHGTPLIQKCFLGTVWSDILKICVVFNSEQDTCTQDNAQRECAELQGEPHLIPHPSACQRYYNCSNTILPGQFSYLGKYEEECPYSQVFDGTEKKCKSFKEGYCGPRRIAAKDPCDYFKNRCGSSHCEPCSSRLPSCVGLTDGRHEHPQKLWSPYFVTCDTERLASVQTCSSLDPTGWNVIFSPVKKVCVSRWEVPREFGGLAPSCEGKPPGQYRTVESPRVYYTCPSADVSYCEVGFEFNEASGKCEK